MAKLVCPACGAPLRTARRFCPTCGTDLRPVSVTRSSPRPEPAPSRRVWESAGAGGSTATGSSFRPGRIPRWGYGAVAVAVGVVIVVILASNNWYGVGSSGGGGGTTPTGPDPNPYNETVHAVLGSVVYTGSQSGYFASIQGINLCDGCPLVPRTYPGFSPPVAGFNIYVNITNSGTQFHYLSRYALTALNGANTTIFHLGGVYCCAPAFDEVADQVGLTAGQTLELKVFIIAPTIPSNGGLGYTLEFIGTSSS